VLAGDVLDEQILRPIGVLVFVHHHIAKAVRVALANGRVLLEKLHRGKQQIVEIKRAGIP
jgi:hypothetical protein